LGRRFSIKNDRKTGRNERTSIVVGVLILVVGVLILVVGVLILVVTTLIQFADSKTNDFQNDLLIRQGRLRAYP
jgi:uncharacterized membrane protein YdbT with pleckstrin-like domain